MVSKSIVCFTTFVASALSMYGVGAFTIPSIDRQRSHKNVITTELNLFGKNLKDAFANDDTLGKAKNAGLKNGPKTNDSVTVNGKTVNAVVGQKVSVVAAQARAKISYNCKQGDCGTCMININGRKVKACQATIPAGKCAIKTT